MLYEEATNAAAIAYTSKNSVVIRAPPKNFFDSKDSRAHVLSKFENYEEAHNSTTSFGTKNDKEPKEWWG